MHLRKRYHQTTVADAPVHAGAEKLTEGGLLC